MDSYWLKRAMVWFAFGIAVLLAIKFLLVPTILGMVLMAQGFLVSFGGLILLLVLVKFLFRRR